MKRFFYAVAALVWLTASCTGNKANSNDDVVADSVDTIDTASVDSMETLIAEQPMPKAADMLFDDFIFNFAANRKLQFSRITFPLPVVSGTRCDSIAKKAWKMERFFMHQGYYTLLFNSRKQMRLNKDTTVGSVTLERINLRKNRIKQFCFNRVNGLWMLQRIVNKSLSASPNASFLAFYQKFATDSAFQCASLAEAVAFSGPDPDDDFATMEGVITPDTWEAFAPELPKDVIYNIQYGATYGQSSTCILLMQGIANGLEQELTFKRQDGKWILTKLNM